jgi:hypothetical protein
MSIPTLPNVVDEVNRLVDQAQQQHLNLRLIGGLAVRLHSPNMEAIGLKREYPDIDFVAHKREQNRLEGFFGQMGYAPDKMFNALNGGRRQIYYDRESGRHIDVFIGDFEMCHKLPLHDRLHAHPLTVPLAELFLSKTQIVQLNKKDALDLIALLLNNPLGDHDDGMINVDRIARLCARDWGLYTTTMLNLGRLETILKNDNPGLNEQQVQTVRTRIETIRQAMQRVRKPLRWRVRNRVGTRLRWYAEVEEVKR